MRLITVSHLCTHLIDLDYREDADDVHDGRVELKSVVGRADVVADAEHALEDQGEAQR